MKHKELGKTGIKVPPIVFGTSALGNLYNASEYPIKLEIVRECLKNVAKPVVFDCAGKYGAGLALEMLGKCLHELNVNPVDIIISNKLGWLRIPLKSSEPTFEPGVWKDIKYDAIQKINYNGIMECWEQGNELLGKTYVPQLVSVHDPDEYINQAGNKDERNKLLHDIIDAYRALFELKSQKKVAGVGVGAKDWKIIQELFNHIELDWVMFANSMTIMNHPRELTEFMEKLKQRGIGIINSAVFHAGFLTGGNYYDYKIIKPDSEENKTIFKWREKFFGLCEKHNITPALACVNFALSAPGVVSISLNTSNPKRIIDNVGLVMDKVPEEFWKDMIKNKLISPDYQYLNY